jgi:molybdopterin-guanine dinucleotide biosynthesis protein A
LIDHPFDFAQALRCGGDRALVDRAVYYRRMHSDVAVFILTGGKSTRMGTDKAFLKLEGRTLIERMLDIAKSVALDVSIVGSKAKFGRFGPTIEDIYPDCGPLGGIHAALRASSSELNLIVAVDMPFLSLELLEYVIGRGRNSSAHVVVPHLGGGYQPLCAVYRRDFANRAESALQRGRFKIDALFAEDSTEIIEEDELKRRGFSEQIFRNCNTPAELAEARGHKKQ